VLEHEEAMGDRFETEMEPTGAHRALEVGVDRLERRWRALGVRSANTVVLGRWSWKRQRGRTRMEWAVRVHALEEVDDISSFRGNAWWPIA
jgi:hypothetical protein